MNKKPTLQTHIISETLIQKIIQDLLENKKVRKRLPLSGLLNIDRQLPFLFLYRSPVDRWDGGTAQLITGQASYLLSSTDMYLRKSLIKLTHAIVSVLSQEFGAFLLIEIWSKPAGSQRNPKNRLPIPEFRIFANPQRILTPTVQSLESSLKKFRILKQNSKVFVHSSKQLPPHYKPILNPKQALKLQCHWIGLETEPIYQQADLRKTYPLVTNALHRSLSRALKQTVFKFIRTQTKDKPQHYQALGKRQLVKAVWETDGKLATLCEQFDLLLMLNPLNSQSAWLEFKRNFFQKTPKFYYPPLPLDPALIKRKLYNIPIERIEDPVLLDLFQEKRREIDRQLTLLVDRDTKRFSYGSLQLYGGIDPDLLKTSQEMLNRFPPHSREDAGKGSYSAEQFAQLAEQEIKYYRKQLSEFSGNLHVTEGPATLMVSNGSLYIGKRIKIPKLRASALIHHEIGTHMLTYFNAKVQPFQLLHSGLAGYDELQEGLAVLAEYLCGGLSCPRLRLIAARVVATHCMLSGASFIEVFRKLDRYYEFEQRTAFTITLRVFRGGGFTKDAVYLRGLLKLLSYLKENGSFDTLLLGKFAIKHVPMLQDLRWRRILQDPPLTPRYLSDSLAQTRLKRLRSGISIFDLLEETIK